LSTVCAPHSLADGAAAAGKGPKLCLAPGVYDLEAPLRLTAEHATLTIEACGPGVFLQPARGSRRTDFSDGLVVVAQTASVTLRGLTLLPGLVPLPPASLKALAVALAESLSPEQIKAIVPRLGGIIAVRAVNSSEL